MAQSVERHLGKVEVTGSIPVGSLRRKLEKIKALRDLRRNEKALGRVPFLMPWGTKYTLYSINLPLVFRIFSKQKECYRCEIQ